MGFDEGGKAKEDLDDWERNDVPCNDCASWAIAAHLVQDFHPSPMFRWPECSSSSAPPCPIGGLVPYLYLCAATAARIPISPAPIDDSESYQSPSRASRWR